MAASCDRVDVQRRSGQYPRQVMARQAVGPRRTTSFRRYVRGPRILGALSVLILVGGIVWDLLDDGFWARHTLCANLIASLIVVAVSAAVVNEVLDRRQRQRWSVVAQYALFEFIRTARLVWTSLLELAGLTPDEELGQEAVEAGMAIVRDTPRMAAAVDRLLAGAGSRQQLHRLIGELLGHGQEALGRWAGVMVSSGAYAEVLDRHVELYSRLYWWGSVLDESEPLQEHLGRPALSRVSPATQTAGVVEEAWLRDNLVAIAQLAVSLERGSFELAMRIVAVDWWTAQLPDRPSVPEEAAQI